MLLIQFVFKLYILKKNKMIQYFLNVREVVCNICLFFEERVMRGVRYLVNMIYYYYQFFVVIQMLVFFFVSELDMMIRY